MTADLVGHGSYNNVKSLLNQLGMKSNDITLNMCNENTNSNNNNNRYGTNVNYNLSSYNFYKAFKETLRDELNALALSYE